MLAFSSGLHNAANFNIRWPAGFTSGSMALSQSSCVLRRWDIEVAYAPNVAINRTYVRHAGFLSAVDSFDADAFRCAHDVDTPL